MKKLFETNDALSTFILRVMLGLVIFPHGAQKLLGWFGGFGFSGTMGFFTGKMGLPAAVAFLIIIGESLGSVALIAGFLTRFTAASLAVIMIGAIALVHWPYGFFANWFGNQAGEGFEYHLLVIAISIALVVAGGGKWSADRAIEAKLAH
ncbi:MAG TPA: DoxX family protein [Candidatus Manganitrophaceae bacterium]|nr:DoxX family protein [Candidatus Manganitrophaceae bacterium]